MNTTTKITQLIQKKIQYRPFKEGVDALKSEYLLPDMEGDDLLDAYIQFGDALEKWFNDQVPEDSCSRYLCFLHHVLEYVRWDLVAQHLHVGSWEEYPEDDRLHDGHKNSLTHEASMWVDSTGEGVHKEAAELVRKKMKGVFTQKQLAHALSMLYHERLTKEDREKGMTKFPHRDVVTAGIECVHWEGIAKNLLADAMSSLEMNLSSVEGLDEDTK